jgi:hypothetical protein
MASEPDQQSAVPSTGPGNYNRMPSGRDHHYTAPQATSGATACLGLWLLIAPGLLDYQGQQALAASHASVGTGPAYWNSVIIGIVVIALGVSAAVSTHRGHARRRHR